MGQVRWKMWLPDKNVTKCHEIRAQSLWCCPLGIQTVSVSVTGILARGDRQEQADNSHAVCPIDKLIFIQNVKCTRLTWSENKVRVNSIHCIANKAVVQWNDAEICKQNFPYGYKCVIIDEFCVQDRKHTRRQQRQHSDRIVGTFWYLTDAVDAHVSAFVAFVAWRPVGDGIPHLLREMFVYRTAVQFTWTH